MKNIVEQKITVYINAIEKSLKDANWASALAISLMIPDICSKLEYFDIEGVGNRYRKWFDEYLYEEYNNWQPMMSAHDFYALRCSYLHAGETDISENKQRKIVDEFKFMAPKVSNGEFSGSHLIKINNYLILRIDSFCLEISVAVNKWIEKNRDDKRIQKEVKKIIEVNDDPINYGGIYIE